MLQGGWEGRGAGRGQGCLGPDGSVKGAGEEGRGLRRGVRVAGVVSSRKGGSGMLGGGIRGAEGVGDAGEMSVLSWKDAWGGAVPL